MFRRSRFIFATDNQLFWTVPNQTDTTLFYIRLYHKRDRRNDYKYNTAAETSSHIMKISQRVVASISRPSLSIMTLLGVLILMVVCLETVFALQQLGGHPSRVAGSVASLISQRRQIQASNPSISSLWLSSDSLLPSSSSSSSSSSSAYGTNVGSDTTLQARSRMYDRVASSSSLASTMRATSSTAAASSFSQYESSIAEESLDPRSLTRLCDRSNRRSSSSSLRRRVIQ